MRRSPDASRLTPGRALPLQMRRLRLRKTGVRPATCRPAQTAGGLSGDSELRAVRRVSAASVQPTGFRTRLATGRPLPHGMRGRKRRLKAPEAGRASHRGLCARFLGRASGTGLRRAEEGWLGRGQSGPQWGGSSREPRGSHRAGRGGLRRGAGPSVWPHVEARGTGLCMSWSWHRPPSPSKEGETWDQEDPSSPGPGAGCEQARPAAGVGRGPEGGTGVGHHSNQSEPGRPILPRGRGQGEAPRGSRPPGPQVPWAVSRGASRPGPVQGGRGSGEGLRRPSLPAPRLKPTAQTRPRVASCMKTPCSLWGVQTTQLSRKQRSPQTPPRRGSPPRPPTVGRSSGLCRNRPLSTLPAPACFTQHRRNRWTLSLSENTCHSFRNPAGRPGLRAAGRASGRRTGGPGRSRRELRAGSPGAC